MKPIYIFLIISLLSLSYGKAQNLEFYIEVVNTLPTQEVQVFAYNSVAGTENLYGPTIGIHFDNTITSYQSIDLTPTAISTWVLDQIVSSFQTPTPFPNATGFIEAQIFDGSGVGSNIGAVPVHLFSLIFNTPGASPADFTAAGTSNHPAMVYLGSNSSGAHSVVIGTNPGSFPVELLSFEVEAIEGDRSLLTWTTASELNNKGFKIQRVNEASASDWTELGFVEGQGTTSELTDYTFIDPSPRPGENLYRLMQVDINGDFEYSEVRTVWFDQGVGVNVYPNPTFSYVNVKFEDINLNNDTAKYSIQDQRGRLVSEGKINALDISRIDFSNLPEGTYYLKLQYEGKTAVKEVVRLN